MIEIYRRILKMIENNARCFLIWQNAPKIRMKKTTIFAEWAERAGHNLAFFLD